jgi:hypothetical protein
MAGETDKSRRYLRWAAANEQRAASAYNEELKTLFLRIAAQYRDLAEQIDDPEQWRAKRRGRTGPTITELHERIALIRENINELVERAAAYSGAEDENRTAGRIAEQEQELAKLIELRDALLRR